MKILDEYFDLQKKIYEYFGYQEDWVVIPLADNREYFWKLDGEGPGHVYYAETKETLASLDTDREIDGIKIGHYYEDEIYTQRFLPKWVYRGEEYTMICCIPHVDGNRFLRIFDNRKEL